MIPTPLTTTAQALLYRPATNTYSVDYEALLILDIVPGLQSLDSFLSTSHFPPVLEVPRISPVFVSQLPHVCQVHAVLAALRHIVHSCEHGAEHSADRRACQGEKCEMGNPDRRARTLAVTARGEVEWEAGAQYKDSTCRAADKQQARGDVRPVLCDWAHRR